jgi:hypothetical protein
MDLKKDIREAVEPLVLDDFQMSVVLAAVLPHLEAAYKRGEMAGSSRTGYKIPKPREEEQ